MSGFALKLERLRRDLSQWDLGRLSNIPPYRISEIECERAEARPDEADRLRRALDEIDPVRG